MNTRGLVGLGFGISVATAIFVTKDSGCIWAFVMLPLLLSFVDDN